MVSVSSSSAQAKNAADAVAADDDSSKRAPGVVLEVAQLRFTLLHPSTSPAAADVSTKLLTAIRDHEMAPFCRSLVALAGSESASGSAAASSVTGAPSSVGAHAANVSPLLVAFPSLNQAVVGAPLDAFLADLEAKNAAHISTLDARHEDAVKNAGATEICEALTAKAHYLAQIADLGRALPAYRAALEVAATLGSKIDLVFAIVRLAFFFADRALAATQLSTLRALVEEGGDWDRRNRLKVYDACFLLAFDRDFTAAAPLLLDSLATFSTFELLSQQDFLVYTVLAASLVLPRTEFKTRVLESPEIAEFVDEVPHLASFMSSLFECKYCLFFETLAHMEAFMKADVRLHAHYRFYVREMRIKAYAQLLESYRSLTISYMAAAFGVTADFIERDLFRFISNGRLNCVIDKVRGVVETNRPDNKNAMFQSLVKQGDLLLNRVQKLGRIISI